jgi:hypothetical protein|tara:strand:+ start:687 stop:2951 length:2265 start_codon:yes stop_codon:yes gene_type:complete
MRKLRVPLSNFQFGEVSPSLISRTDSKVYSSSAQKVENFFLRAEGGVIKRAGLSNIYEFDTTVDTSKTQQHRIIPYIFSDDERYIISLENLKIRVFRVDTSFNVTLATTITQDSSSAALPFTHDNIHEVTYAQSGDTMFIAHQTFMVRKLVRTGLTSFAVETYTFDQNSANTIVHQPYFSFQTPGVTLDPSATSGSGVTFTTSSAYWDTTGSQSGGDYPNSLHVGINFRYNDSEFKITSVQSATQATGTVFGNLKRRLKVDSFRTSEGVGTVEVTLLNHGLAANAAFTVDNASAVGGIARSNLNGARTVSEVIDDNTFTFTAGANATSAAAGGGTPTLETHAPVTEWSEQSYSALRGFPAAVAFHQNRLWYGGTLGQPDGLWGSKTGTFFNFDVGEAADNDALDLTASIGDINTIRHIISNKDLHVFTSTDEFIVPALQGAVTTPTNASIERQTSFGSSFLRPYLYDGATVFVDSSGSMVREFIFSDAVKGYTGQPISTLSSHLINTPIQMAMLSGAIGRAENYLFIVDADGSIAVFNSNRVEQRAGWTQFTSQGSFHSVCVIDTRVYAVVKFDKGDGTNKYFLCEFSNSFNTDLAKTYSGTNGVFSVSSDFANGAVVDVVNGTFYLGSFTVSGGNVDVSSVDSSISSAEIGLKFDVTLKTNPIDAVVADGPLTGEFRTVQRVVLDLNNTLSVTVNNTNLIIRQVTDDMSQPRNAITGKKEFRLLGFGRDPQITITQNAPLALQINSIVAEVAF